MSESVFSWISPKLEVKETGRYGIGVFAAENIKKGHVVKILSGEVIPLDEGVKRINEVRHSNQCVTLFFNN
jgi:SET domain-containing protein